MQSIDPEQLKQLLDRPGTAPYLLDVRDPWEFELCHIDGSTNIPMTELRERVEQLDHECQTVVICHYGARSAQVAGYLESIGFSNIVNLDGGLDAWAGTVDTDMPRY